jgi:hypothetical protein
MESFDEADFATREEWLAATEAAAIGGGPQPEAGPVDPSEHIDPAMLPVYEAGGGERDLIRNASHDDGIAFPERDAFTPEIEADEATVEYGEADEEEKDR